MFASFLAQIRIFAVHHAHDSRIFVKIKISKQVKYNIDLYVKGIHSVFSLAVILVLIIWSDIHRKYFFHIKLQYFNLMIFSNIGVAA